MSEPGIELREEPGRKPVYEIIWYEKSRRKRKSTGTDCRADAHEKLAEFILARGEAVRDCDPAQRRIADVLSAYVIEHGPCTARPGDVVYFTGVLSKFWGESVVADITKKTCAEYAAWSRRHFEDHQRRKFKKGVTREKSPASVRRELEVLRAALRYDYGENRLASVPQVHMPRRPPPRERWLTGKEAARLLRAARQVDKAGGYLPLFIRMALYTAARKEAILSRRWTDIRFAENYIDFGEGRGNKKRARPPIPKGLRRELLRARDRGSDIGWIFYRNVWREENGARVLYQEQIGDIRKAFAKACEIAGLEDVTPHTLKHTAISWMVQKGVAFAKIAKWANTTVATIESTYGHLAPEHLKDIEDAYG